MKIVLSVNAGSSSVKISVYAVDRPRATPRRLAEAQISGLTAPPPKLDYSRGSTTVHKAKEVTPAPDSQDAAFAELLRTLVDDDGLEAVPSADAVAVVAHRIVHGGDYDRPQLIVSDTLHHLERLSDLAPLHNGPALEIVRSCLDQLPGATNVACFDSQFHHSIPPHVSTYAIDPAVARGRGLRKYGFHGISYAFIVRAAAAFLGRDEGDTNLIALHLGSGASACAIEAGRSRDTSMGLTPLAGLPGATRSGSVDPSLVFHYASPASADADVGRPSPSSTASLHISRAEEILNKEAGWKALAGTTDFGAIAAEGAPATHQLAFDLFVDRVAAFVGSYYVSLRGRVDALVFAGGIGERSARLRAAVVDQCACLGFVLDDAANAADLADDPVVNIGKEGARHRVLVCRTDEQFEMARWCAEDQDLWEK